MNLLKDVLKELLGMFLADARLTVAVLVLFVAVTASINLGIAKPLAGGAGLMVGCLVILAAVTILQARRD